MSISVVVVLVAIVVLAWVIYKNAYRSKLPFATPKVTLETPRNNDAVNYYVPPDMAYWHKPGK
jgi:hypothetical protein